jgi:hypothetical protein
MRAIRPRHGVLSASMGEASDCGEEECCRPGPGERPGGKLLSGQKCHDVVHGRRVPGDPELSDGVPRVLLS